MITRDIMSADPATITPDAGVDDAARVMRERGVSMLPVVDDSLTLRLRGVITDRDIVERCVAAGHPVGCRVRDHMTATHLVTIRPDDDVDTLIQRMTAGVVHRLPVVDTSGRVAGIVTHSDVVMSTSAHDSAS